MNTQRLAVGLGWFSLALGTIELLGGRPLARWLGVERRTGLVRLFGLREIAAGIGVLTARERAPWIWARVAGDALDLAALGAAFAGRNPQRGAVAFATTNVALVSALDVVCGLALSNRSLSAT